MKTHGRPWADYIYILGRTEPAPTVSGSPCRACRMKLLTTRPSFMCMRGPKVLKILATRTSTPSWNRDKRSERTPESATLPPCLHYPAHEAHHKTRFITKSRWLFSDCMMCSLHTPIWRLHKLSTKLEWVPDLITKSPPAFTYWEKTREPIKLSRGEERYLYFFPSN